MIVIPGPARRYSLPSASLVNDPERPFVNVLTPSKVLDAESTGISDSSTLTSTVPLAPLSTILFPKLELSALSLANDAVFPIRI